MAAIAPSPPPPGMALRTYTALRLGSIAVIATLGIAIFLDWHRSPARCLQGSISAYYYTDVRSVFVGTLLVLGFSMIVLWGKTPFENGFLNLAGMLAPIVAFAPSQDANRCNVKDVTGDQVKRTQDVLDAQLPAIQNNMRAYFIIVGLALLALLVIGIFAIATGNDGIIGDQLAYWGGWALGLGLFVVGLVKFQDQDWFSTHAHSYAANTMFAFIGIVVIDIGVQKWKGNVEPGGPQPQWAIVYWSIAALMVVGAILFMKPMGWLPVDVKSHHVFVLEAWEITLLAVFWLLQTADRAHDGAPQN